MFLLKKIKTFTYFTYITSASVLHISAQDSCPTPDRF